MKKKSIVALSISSVLLMQPLSTLAVSNNDEIVEARQFVGWQKNNGSWTYYLTNGNSAKGWNLINSKWYYFNQSGIMQTGWIKLSNQWYYLNPSGDMAIGWKQINNRWYYFVNSGVMQTGWLKHSNQWYYLNSNGDMATGWKQVNNRWYYFVNTGVMQTGWLHQNNQWYYLGSGGQMLVDWILLGGKWYHLQSNGVMSTGWLNDKNEKYYLKENGQMLVGIQKIANSLYYFNASGKMQVGWIEYGGNRYYANPNNGELAIGIVQIEGETYVFNEQGILQPKASISGWYEDEQFTYYYNEGQYVTDWFKIQNNWYYFNSQGQMQTGWQNIKGSWYYMDSNGKMLNGWQSINGFWYYMKENGAMQTGWLKLGTNWYYLKSNGAMVTGKQTINNKVYFFTPSGIWTKGNVVTNVSYNLSLNEMLNKQMVLSTPPQTDKYRNAPSYVSAEYIEVDKTNPNKGKTTANLNVREATSATSHKFTQLAKGTDVTIISTTNGWHRINYAGSVWRNAKREDVSYYVNPTNFKEGTPEFLQFLVLSKSADTNADELNEKILKGKGILDGKAKVFHQASATQNINEVYLISHAILETGNGTSKLAKGIEVGLNKKGEPEMVTTENKANLTAVKTVYNMFGIGAIDANANKYGSERAYKEEWDTPDKAIIGGAKFVGEKYIHDPNYRQDTLYKMRWNPANPATHQYATDMAWAEKQTRKMNEIYNLLDAYTLYFEVPVYK